MVLFVRKTCCIESKYMDLFSVSCRMAEHAYVSNRAEEERKKRPNYRPIIDHDGVPRQRPSNQVYNTSGTL